MNNKQLLAVAIEIAIIAHKNQFDKVGNPYILHPLYVMNQLLFDTELAIMGILHDAIEDTLITITNLSNYGFSDRVLNGLSLLTHNPEDSYKKYIIKLSNNYDAIRVKRKDLKYNSDITRLKEITEKDLNRIKKYHKAFIFLGKCKKKKKIKRINNES